MIERSEASRYAKALFYINVNDIDVYVEDTASESKKVYVEILNRVFAKKFLISQVFPIGSKPTVLKRCVADQGPRARPAVYIVDGDYDVLFGKPLPALNRLYRLKRYCIENYLLDVNAVVDVLSDESIDLDEQQIRKRLDFPVWISKIGPALSSLTKTLGAAHVKQCGLSTVKINLSGIQGAHWDHVDGIKVLTLENSYQNAIDAQYGAGTFRGIVSNIHVVCHPPGELFRLYASGKSLLMPLFLSRIKRRVGIEVDYQKFRVKLSRRCDVADFFDLPQCVV